MSVPRRGQVWDYVVGSQQLRVLILTSDEINDLDGVTPWGLVVSRSLASLAVPLTGSDPAGLADAHVRIDHVLRIAHFGLRRCHGFLSHETMSRVEEMLRDLLDLA